MALIGAGGIGKTSIALSVLHHARIKNKFGDNRRFMRCDQFPASRTHFLARLSKVIGAGVENPEDLTPLRPFLLSKETLIILDNAESVLDPQGPDAREIYGMVSELCQIETICLCITSRITTVPPHCTRPGIPTLSMEAACDIFYGIYCGCERSEVINNLLQRLDFHALSITLLATTASHNMWDYDRLTEEWGAHRARVLRTDYNESLAATIELSLSSPTFCKLGPDARDLLGVVAFYPQGINEKNLDWFFPAIPDKRNIFDKFCVLSLTYRNNGFTTMLAPIRDYLCPKDPTSSPLLCATKDCYLTRLSVDVGPQIPGFGEARWIVSENVNVEHLLNVFTSIDAGSQDVWDGCHHFVEHITWHKPRPTVLTSKIEGLPDDHPSKPRCLYRLSDLFGLLGNQTERRKLLARALQLWRGRGSDIHVAAVLVTLADVNRSPGFFEEGIEQAKEALEIYKRFGDTRGQSTCFHSLAWLFIAVQQLDAAEDAVSQMIALVSEKGEELLVSQSHCLLGNIYCSKGEGEKAIRHFKTALEIVSRFDWPLHLFKIHYELARLFRGRHQLDDANTHIEQAKSHASDNAYYLGYATEMQAVIWGLQGRFEDSKSEALRALEIYEKLGATKDAGDCRDILQRIERAAETQSTEVSSWNQTCGLHPLTPPS